MRKFIQNFSRPPMAPFGVVLLLLLVTAGAIQAGDNKWTTVGPYGGSINAMVRASGTPNTIYVGTWGGVWFSTDAGTTWTSANSGLDFTTITSMIADSANHLFVGTIGGGVYQGLIAGGFATPTAITWTSLSSGLTNFNVTGLALDNDLATGLYAATESAGVFKYTSGTGKFSAVNSGLAGSALFIRSLYLDRVPTTPVLYIGTDAGGVYSKATNIASWAAVGGTTNPLTNTTTNNVNAVVSYTQLAASTSFVYAGTDAGGVYYFDGTSWSVLKVTGGTPLVSLVGADVTSLALFGDLSAANAAGHANSVSYDSIYVYAGTDKKGLYYFNPTVTLPTPEWKVIPTTAVQDQTPTDTHIRSVWLGSPGGVAIGSPWNLSTTNATSPTASSLTMSTVTWRGAFKSADGGTTWSSANGTTQPIITVRAYSIGYLTTSPAVEGRVFVGTHGGGVYSATPNSISWDSSGYTSTLPLDLDVFSVAVDPRTSTVYAGTGSEGIFKSTTLGAGSWTNIGMEGRDVRSVLVDPSNSSVLYAGTWQGVYKTTNGGITWSTASGLLPAVPPNVSIASNLINVMVMNPANVLTIYAGTNGGVFKTTDGGNTWALASTGITTSYINALVLNEQTPNILYAGTLGGGVFKTTNGGTSWTALHYNMLTANIFSLALDPLNTSVVYAGCDQGMIYKTMDGGANWSIFAPRLDDASATSPNIKSAVRALTMVRQVDRIVLFVGTDGNGVYQIRLPSLLFNRPIDIVSTDSSSILGNGMSYNGKVSVASGNDGRYVAFQSVATNLVSGDTNGFSDIFVKDRVTAKTVRVSVAADGTQANGDSYTPVISQDGRYVAFASRATNLVFGDTNGVADIFLYDRDVNASGTYDTTGNTKTIRISVNSNGNQADNYSLTPSISNDGRFVAFASYAANLVGDPTAFRTATTGVAYSQIFIHDRLGSNTSGQFDIAGGYQVRLVSHTNAALFATPASGDATLPSLSGDAAFVAYQTRATANLGANNITPTNKGLNVVVSRLHPGTGTLYDTATGFNVWRATGTAAGSKDYGNDGGFNYSPVSLSSGNSNVYTVAFYTPTDPGVAGGPGPGSNFANGQVVYCSFTTTALAHCTTWTTASALSGVTTLGGGASGTFGVSISGDASRIAFTSLATDLLPSTGAYAGFDTNGQMDIYVRNLSTLETTRHSVAADGSQGNAQSELPALTANGNFVAFHSWADNLVPGDGNNTVDVFVARVVTTTTTQATTTTTTSSTVPSPAGQGVRTLTGCYVAGYTTPVILKVTPGSMITVYTVEETVPPGWTVLPADISNSGTWDAATGKVRWGPFYDALERTFTYKTTAGQVTKPSGVGVQVFSGLLTFEGYNNGTTKVVTAGDTTEYDNCQMHPADTNKDLRLEAGEVTAYSFAWITGQIWAIPPNPIPLGYVARAGYLWRNGEVYRYKSTVTAPDCWYPYSASATTASHNVGDLSPMVFGGAAANRREQ